MIPEEILNSLVTQLGNPSDGGAYIPTTGELGEGMECEFFGELDCPQPVSSPQPATRASPLSRPDGTTISAQHEVSQLSIAQCRSGSQWLTVLSGKPITWQWWVTDARFDALEGTLGFSAKVRYRVGTRWGSKESSVKATAAFESNSVRFAVERFKVPIYYEFQEEQQRVTEVDVAKLYSFSIAVHPQKLSFARPGAPLLLTARAVSMTPHYEEGQVRLDVDVGIQ